MKLPGAPRQSSRAILELRSPVCRNRGTAAPSPPISSSGPSDTADSMKRVLLLLPTTGYRNNDFLAAAKKLGVEIVAAANYCHQLAPSWGLAPIMALHFDRPEQAADTVLREIGGNLDAVLAVGDSGVGLAALLLERLGLPGDSPPAGRRVRGKLAVRRLVPGRGFLCPAF